MALYVDSDSEDEPLKRSVAHSQRLCDVQSREQQQQQEEPEKVKDSFLSVGFIIHVHFLLLRGENIPFHTEKIPYMFVSGLSESIRL